MVSVCAQLWLCGDRGGAVAVANAKIPLALWLVVCFLKHLSYQTSASGVLHVSVFCHQPFAC